MILDAIEGCRHNPASRKRLAVSGFDWQPLHYLSILLTSFSTLLYELALSRLLSLAFYPNIAYFAISTATLGLGIGGIYSQVLSRRRHLLQTQIQRLTFATAVAIMTSLIFMVRIAGRMHPLDIATAFVLAALPFATAGCTNCCLVGYSPKETGCRYAVDLVGAAVACIVYLPLTKSVGSRGAMLIAASLMFPLVILWSDAGRGWAVRCISLLLGVILLSSVCAVSSSSFLQFRFIRGIRHPAITANPSGSSLIVGTSPRQQTGVDSHPNPDIPSISNTSAYVPRLAPLIQSLQPGGPLLLVGATDAAPAEPSRLSTYSGTICNSSTAALRSQPYTILSNVSDLRAHIQHTSLSYAAIVLDLCWSSIPEDAGAHSLEETYQYTAEAFHDYMSHLTPNGLLVITGISTTDPLERTKITLLARKALEGLGKSTFAQHLVTLRQSTYPADRRPVPDTFIISLSPWTADTLSAMTRLAAQAGWVLLCGPHDYEQQTASHLNCPAPAAYPGIGTALSRLPATDNRPYFFFDYPDRGLRFYSNTHGSTPRLVFSSRPSLSTLAIALLVSTVGALFLLILSHFVLSIRPPVPAASQFFFFITGTAYFMVQIPLVAAAALPLGTVARSLPVVIALFLVTGSLASFTHSKIIRCSAHLRLAVVIVVALLTLTAYGLQPLFHSCLSYSLAARFFLVSALVVPIGFSMGLLFPSGLFVLLGSDSGGVRLAWSVSATAGVCGTLAATLLSVCFGFYSTILLAASCYCLALLGLGCASTNTMKRLHSLIAVELRNLPTRLS